MASPVGQRRVSFPLSSGYHAAGGSHFRGGVARWSISWSRLLLRRKGMSDKHQRFPLLVRAGWIN
jgi:hypothetical protein